ncbi:MAG: hypothetical protein JO295_14840 [Verrucomicrobia bacterium]|nr:hypothetical protein [Verrucomicrobiota bacterium]
MNRHFCLVALASLSVAVAIPACTDRERGGREDGGFNQGARVRPSPPPQATPTPTPRETTTTRETPTPPPSTPVQQTPVDYPYATPVAGKPGFVTSPYAPEAGLVDVRGMSPGQQARDPYTNKIFLVP